MEADGGFEGGDLRGEIALPGRLARLWEEKVAVYGTDRRNALRRPPPPSAAPLRMPARRRRGGRENSSAPPSPRCVRRLAPTTIRLPRQGTPQVRSLGKGLEAPRGVRDFYHFTRSLHRGALLPFYAKSGALLPYPHPMANPCQSIPVPSHNRLACHVYTTRPKTKERCGCEGVSLRLRPRGPGYSRTNRRPCAQQTARDLSPVTIRPASTARIPCS